MSAERLQKIISAAGLASRRQAEEWILAGRVAVNGEVVRELGAKADWDADRIEVDGKSLKRAHRLYYLLNKPYGVITSLQDPEGRKTVADLAAAAGVTDTLRSVMNKPLETPEWEWICNWLRDVIAGRRRPCILWVGGRSGEIVFDFAILRILIKIGIKVILAVKQDFYYHRVSFVDLLEDPTLDELLEDADIIGDAKISKNELLRHLDSDNRFLVISDGTREPFNPLLTSVTYARAFKEADLVVYRNPGGRENISNHFQFTRDIVSIIPGDDGEVDILLKLRHPKAVRFSRAQLRRKAQDLINMVELEKEQGKTIMFYSAIVGSIPGQLKTAKEILNVFVEYLRSSLHDVVIINPGEHFVEGMDADDIMYMWEIFQRSGNIDIWRFQSVDDIVKSFELMGKKVPPEWTGKDATYSTGCTKEMEIAIQIQKLYPEMQLIGPPYEKFQRRKEYGVGKLYDRTLAGSE